MSPAHGVSDPLARGVRPRLRLLGGFVALCWAAALVDAFLPPSASLVRFGIRPRHPESLVNIAFAPFLHIGFAHLLANTAGIVTLGGLVLARGARPFLVVSVVAAGVSGAGVWVVGDPRSAHVGASGIVFGYLGFLLTWGYLARSAGAFVLALAVAVVFGWMLWGLLPTAERVSWEGHLFGLVGGVLAARLMVAGAGGSVGRGGQAGPAAEVPTGGAA